MGLGLTIAKEIVESHGGDIGVERDNPSRKVIGMIIDHVGKWNIPEGIPSIGLANGVRPLGLVRGHSYLVKEPKPDVSFDLFAYLSRARCPQCDNMNTFSCECIGCEDCTLPCPCKDCNHERARGMCFTTYSPEDVRYRYNLQTTPIFWISNSGNDSIKPSNLEMIANTINMFLKNGENRIVLLDGAEYLIFANGFDSVLKFLHDVQEWVIIHKAILIVPVSPPALKERELAIIERNMDQIDTNSS